MPSPRLRIYCGPQEDATVAPATVPLRETATVSVGEILPLLVDAARSDRTWLKDFADDEITISSDLYEVILAYQHYRRPSA